MHRPRIGFLVMLALAFAPPAGAQVELNSASDWSGWSSANGWVKDFDGAMQWGNDSGTGGDWEYAVRSHVSGTDRVVDQEQYAWGASSHDFRFSFDPSSLFASLVVGSGGAAQGNVTAAPGSLFNTLVLWTRAAEYQGGSTLIEFSNLYLGFVGGGGYFLQDLAGDLDAELLVVQDDRLADGFTLSGTAYLEGGSNARPNASFKVGTTATVTPEPVTMALLAAGLAGIAGAARRRRRRDGGDAVA